jgi:hypothetical protein
MPRGLKFEGPDGPYAKYVDDQVELLYVDKEGDVVKKAVNPLNSIACAIDDMHSFTFSLQGPSASEQPKSVYPAPDSIVVIADIEGNFNALYSLLVRHYVMNYNFEWTFKDNSLVILGDVTDKGACVTQCLWLIYHLEQQAHREGGRVHYLLGNHEMMNFELDVRYVQDKYLELAKNISGTDDPAEAYEILLERNKILTDWMKQRNCIEKIGDTLFVHAGISPQFLELGLNIEQANSILNKFLNGESVHPTFLDTVIGPFGPLWYRGLVLDTSEIRGYKKVDESFVDQILSYYDVQRVVVGHTIVDYVSSDYHDKVWRVDVRHGESKFSSQSEALSIENGDIYRLNGAGVKTLLQRSGRPPQPRKHQRTTIQSLARRL